MKQMNAKEAYQVIRKSEVCDDYKSFADEIVEALTGVKKELPEVIPEEGQVWRDTVNAPLLVTHQKVYWMNTWWVRNSDKKELTSQVHLNVKCVAESLDDYFKRGGTCESTKSLRDH